jgi:divalent metal cation (Fe/Co/Zn/Cd) transporter
MNIAKIWKLYWAWKKIKRALKGVVMSDKLKSRKLWVTVGTAIGIVLIRALELPVDDATITKLIALVLGYDVVQGIDDLVGKGKKNSK